MPHRAAGWRIDPPVSVPSESGANPAATAAADPPLEPPGTREGSHGLWVTPKAECSVDEPIANSSMLVLPIGTSPAAFARVTQPASYSGRCPCRIREPAVVSSPRVQRMSLSAIGTPCSPVRPSASSRSASASASVGADAEEGVQAAVQPLDPVEVGLGQLAARELARVEQLDAALGGQAERVDHSCAPPVGGTRNIPSCTAGASRQHLVTRPRRPRLVETRHVLHLQRMGRRRHAGQVELTRARRRGRGSPTAAPPSA